MNNTKRTFTRRTHQNITGYLFLAPWLLLFFLFVAYPFFYGLGMSLFEFNYVKSAFVGLQNYRSLLSDGNFWKSVLATLKISLIVIPCTIVFSMWISYAIYDRSRGLQAFAKAVFYVPSIVSQVALVIVWKWMFNPAYGLSAALTDALGLPRINWLGDLNFAIPLIAMLVLSFSVSQPIILYSATMNNIPTAYYEAAEIDGAKKTTQFFRITLPLMRPTTTFVLITTTIANLQIFAVPYLMTAGGPSYGTTTVLLMIYRNAFEYSRYGYASAMGVVLFAIIAVFALLQFRLTRSNIQY